MSEDTDQEFDYDADRRWRRWAAVAMCALSVAGIVLAARPAGIDERIHPCLEGDAQTHPRFHRQRYLDWNDIEAGYRFSQFATTLKPAKANGDQPAIFHYRNLHRGSPDDAKEAGVVMKWHLFDKLIPGRFCKLDIIAPDCAKPGLTLVEKQACDWKT